MGIFGSIASSLTGNLVSGVLQGYYNRKSGSQQHSYNISDWERQNEYDLPINQMARLKEAGINPHLAYMKGGISNTSSQIHSTSVSAPQIAKFDDFLNIRQRMQDLNLRDAQIRLVNSQNSEAEARIKGLRADNARKEFELETLKKGGVNEDGTLRVNSNDSSLTKIGKSVINYGVRFFNRDKKLEPLMTPWKGSKKWDREYLGGAIKVRKIR